MKSAIRLLGAALLAFSGLCSAAVAEEKGLPDGAITFDEIVIMARSYVALLDGGPNQVFPASTNAEAGFFAGWVKGFVAGAALGEPPYSLSLKACLERYGFDVFPIPLARQLVRDPKPIFGNDPSREVALRLGQICAFVDAVPPGGT